MGKIKLYLNGVRNFLNFRVRHPWVEYGRDVHVQWSTRLWSPHKRMRLGDHVGIGNHCVIITDVEIGNHVLLGSHVALVAKDAHTYNKIGYTVYESVRGDKFQIIIKDDVWIGHGAIILSGVTIGRGSIVAAGSVVGKDIPPYSIVGGLPAVVLRQRFQEEDIIAHEKALEDRGVLIANADDE